MSVYTIHSAGILGLDGNLRLLLLLHEEDAGEAHSLLRFIATPMMPSPTFFSGIDTDRLSLSTVKANRS